MISLSLKVSFRSFAQSHHLAGRWLAAHGRVDKVGPPIEGAPALGNVGRQVVDARDAALVPDVCKARLDDVWRNAEAIMRDGREIAAQIVQRPSRHRLGEADDLACFGDARVEQLLAPGPAR